MEDGSQHRAGPFCPACAAQAERQVAARRPDLPVRREVTPDVLERWVKEGPGA